MEALATLSRSLHEIPSRLGKLPGPARKPALNKWSAKEELGHLLDSAANNHQRIVRVQMENGLALPGYKQEEWVRIHAYQEREWPELIELWTALNQQLLAAAQRVPESAWLHTCTVASSAPQTLKFVFEDYLEHMFHHLQHIGIQVADLRAGGQKYGQRPTTND